MRSCLIPLDTFRRANQPRASEMLGALRTAVSVLNAAGVMHFDAQFSNSLTDGTDFLLADFGLAMSSSFELDDDERAFLAVHQSYDHALLACSIGMVISWIVLDLDEGGGLGSSTSSVCVRARGSARRRRW